MRLKMLRYVENPRQRTKHLIIVTKHFIFTVEMIFSSVKIKNNSIPQHQK